MNANNTNTPSSLPSLPNLPSLSNSVDIFGGLNISGSSLLKNSAFDAISQFLRSSQADFSFDVNMANVSPLLSSVTLSKDVTDEISSYLKDRNLDDVPTNFRSPMLSSIGGGGSDANHPLKRSSLINKQQLDDMPTVTEPTSKNEPPVPQTNSLPADTTAKDNIVKDPVVTSAQTPRKTNMPKVDGLTLNLKRRLSIQAEDGNGKVGNKKKRQEKNREAAQLFRQRQKAKVYELESKMDALLGINNEYRVNIDALFSENKMLSEQLVYWKNVVASGILISRMPGYSSVPETAETRQSFMDEFKKVAESIPPPPPPHPHPLPTQ